MTLSHGTQTHRTWSGVIVVSEMRRSTFMLSLQDLETQDDINQVACLAIDVTRMSYTAQINDFWSYQHFFVIYTCFWKLDTDHDMSISKAQLASYGNYCTVPSP
jgi:serine/threonine-protein phosphatase 2A regulatory subunit B''